MVRFLIGFCILLSCSSIPVEAQQPVLQSMSFKFKAGQSVWLEAYEFPRRFEGILVQVLANGDSVKSGAIAIVARGPLWACGDMEDILLLGSSFRTIAPNPRPDGGAGPQTTAPGRLRTERTPAESHLEAAPAWRIFPAPVVKSALEAAFKKQKKFKIADSVDAADFVFQVLAVPALEPVPGMPTDRIKPVLSSVLALAIPAAHLGRKQAQFQLLSEPPPDPSSVVFSQKQRQLYDLMKDVPWEGVALGLRQGVPLKSGDAGPSLVDLVRCLHKQAGKR